MRFEEDDLLEDRVEIDPPQGELMKKTIRMAILVVIGGVAVAMFARSDMVGSAVDADGGRAPRRAAATAEAGAEAEDAQVGGRELVFRAGRGGHFLVKGEVNGVGIRFLIDTGASTVSLSMKDARRLDIDPQQLEFTEVYHTANGVVRGAPVYLDELRIGQLTLYDVRATVTQGALSISLLGMSFLERLDGYEVKGRELILHW